MKKIRNFLKSYLLGLTGTGGILEGVGEIIPSILTATKVSGVIIQVDEDAYAEVGAQTPVPCTTRLKLWYLQQVLMNGDAEAVSEAAEEKIKALFAHFKGAGTLGQSWIQRVRTEPHFWHAIVEYGDGRRAASAFDLDIDYLDDLSV